MPMYNLIEYSRNSGSLNRYYRDEPALNDAGALVDFPGNSTVLKFKHKITGSKGNDGKKAVKIMVPLKYLKLFLENSQNDII